MKLRLTLCFLLLISFTSHAQESRATISGAVTDPTGSAVAGSKVIATEIRTGTKVQTVSDISGHYTLPFLATGQYDLSATFTGFKEFLRKGIEVGAGDHAVIDIRLEVGDTSTLVEVTAAAPMLNTDNASTGQAITTREVEDIPLNGGTPAMLQQLAIGVIATGTPTLVHPFDLGAPAAFSIGGTRPQTSELLVDGVPDATWDGRAAYNPPRDAVQEVRVKAFDADASFGHTGGGTVNQILKSGTNGLHGSLWEYNQPSNLVANDFFRNRSGQPQQITHFNQYGVTAGGPLVLPHFDGRNRVFWFFAYEGLKDSQPAPALITIPTDAQRGGDFSSLLASGSQYQIYNPYSAVLNGTTITRSPFPNNVIPQSMLNPIAQAYLKYYPEPNVTVGVSPTGVNNYSTNATTTDNYNNELARFDYNMTDNSRMFLNFRNATETQTKNNYFGNVAEGTLLERDPKGATLDEIYTFAPSTVANVRFNFTRLEEVHSLPSSGFNPTTLGFPAYMATGTEYLQMPIMSFSGGSFTNLGANGASNYPSQSMQLFADVVRIHGNHTFKFGTDLRQYRMNFISYGNATGTFAFNNSWTRSSSTASSTVATGQDMASFLMGLPASGSLDLNSYSSFYSYYGAGFLQDSWRAKSNLTINVGIHFDHDGPVREKWGRTVDGFDTNSPSPIAAQAEAAYAKSPIPQLSSLNVPGGLTFASPGNNAVYNNTSHLVSPRVGFAWSPEKLKGTVIRGGLGMFVDPVTIASLSVTGAYSTNPILAQEGYSQTTQMVPTSNNFQSPAATLSNPFPSGFVAPAGSSSGLGTYLGQSISFINPDMKNPYSMRWNFGLQHSIGANTLLEVVYIGNHSVHLPITVTQLNYIPRQYMSTLPVRDNAANTTLAANVTNPFAGLLPNGGNLNNPTTALANLLAPYPQFPVGTSATGWTGSGGVIEQNLSAGSSYFHSLNVRLQRRLSKGLTVIANYQWSRLIEQDSWLNAGDPVPEKRVSPFDHPQRFVTAISYDLPIGRGRPINLHSKWADMIVGGWHLNSVYTFQTGAPLVWVNGSTTTPGDYVYFGGPGALAASFNNRYTETQTNGSPLPSFDTSMFATNAANAFAYHIRTFSTTFPNLRQDGLNEWDPSMLKNFHLTESAYFQLRFEVFNVLNHPTFAAPNLQATGGSFGVISSQANRPRTIQAGARFIW
jgi:hypothetical protein